MQLERPIPSGLHTRRFFAGAAARVEKTARLRGVLAVAVSTHSTLWNRESAALVVTVIFMPLILAYTAWVYKVLCGKVTEAALLFTSEVEKNNKVAIYAFDGEEEIHKITDFTASAGGAEARANSLSSFAPKDKSTNLNGAIVKYGPTGNVEWTVLRNGPNAGWDSYHRLAIDVNGDPIRTHRGFGYSIHIA